MLVEREDIIERALADRVRAVRGGEESPFLKMLALASNYDRVISLGRGDPDLPTPKHIIEAAKAALDRGETKYTAPAGLPALREVVAAKFKRMHGLSYDPKTEITITAGAQEAIFIAMQTLLNPGDEVLVPEPYYLAYETSTAMAGGKLVPVPTRLEDDLEVTAEALAGKITPRTKVLALLSPSNPSGTVLSRDTMERIAKVVEANNLIVVSDELYEHVIYDGLKPTCFASIPGMRERTIVVNGFSKAFCMTGFRVGYMAAPAALTKAMLEPRHTASICTCTVSQYAALAALTGPQDCLAENLAIYDRRRKMMMEGLSAAGMKFSKPKGAFFIFADIRPTGLSSMDFCVKLLEDERVLVFPGNQYGRGSEGYVRISFLADMPELEEATGRIARLYSRLAGN